MYKGPAEEMYQQVVPQLPDGANLGEVQDAAFTALDQCNTKLLVIEKWTLELEDEKDD